MAYRAHAVLLAQHLLVSRCVHPEGSPLALLYVVSVAQILGVQVVVASLDRARLGGRLTVAVHGVPIAKQPLVVRLAQTLSLHRRVAPVLDTFGRLDAYPRLDWTGRRDAALELRVVRDAQTPRVVLAVALADRTCAVCFKHKKKSLPN